MPYTKQKEKRRTRNWGRKSNKRKTYRFFLYQGKRREGEKTNHIYWIVNNKCMRIDKWSDIYFFPPFLSLWNAVHRYNGNTRDLRRRKGRRKKKLPALYTFRINFCHFFSFSTRRLWKSRGTSSLIHIFQDIADVFLRLSKNGSIAGVFHRLFLFNVVWLLR